MDGHMVNGWDFCSSGAEVAETLRDLWDCGDGGAGGSSGTTVVCVVRQVLGEPEDCGGEDDVRASEREVMGLGEECEEGEPRWADRPLAADAFDLHNPAQLGKLGEELASRYLESSGYAIEERNYRTSHGEADIVCRRGEETVLVEVKTRLGAHACPEEAVTHEKIRRYRNITLDYLAREESECQVRFDVIALNVIGAHTARVHHFVGVCSWEG